MTGGTGIVSAELAARGLGVVVVDRSVGMLGLAAGRLPGRVVGGDATRMPLPDASVDLVTTIWLLHLVPDLVDDIVQEVARVLRPGGRWVISVDKHPTAKGPATTPLGCGGSLPVSDSWWPARLVRRFDGLDPR